MSDYDSEEYMSEECDTSSPAERLKELDDAIRAADADPCTSSEDEDDSEDDATSPAIGITIGTTNMSVGVYRNGQVVVIPNEKGERQTPAVIAYTENGIVIGEDAVYQQVSNPENTIRNVMALVGKKYNDLMAERPFFTVSEFRSQPIIDVVLKGKKKPTRAKKMITNLISKMIETAENYLSTRVTKAAVAIPSYFTKSQRTVIRSAMTAAGLVKSSELVEDSTAACRAHGLDGSLEWIMLVLHCGGHTTSATVLKAANNELVRKGSEFNARLGGKDFDEILFKHCRDKFLKDHRIDLHDNARACAKLREAVIRAKVTLSAMREADIRIDCLHRGKDFAIKICRAEMETKCSSEFKSVSALVSRALTKSKIKEKRVDRVVLTGGSTRIPAIKRLVADLFGEHRIISSGTVAPHQAVLHGLVIQAARHTAGSSDLVHSNAKRSVSDMGLVRNKKIRPDSPVIGIDLGTTSSCVGIYQDGDVQIITNEEGRRVTASCVAFTETQRLVGDQAKAHAAIDPVNTVTSVKRLMGKRFDDAAVQQDMKNFLFKVVNQNSLPNIEVEFEKKKATRTPEQISGYVLSKLKGTAEKYMGQDISKAVITVPAYFDNIQRQATKTAAQIAGLEVLRILNEPTAAAIAYGLDKSANGRTILVYDLGGGTFDVSILKVEENSFKVLATAGDTHLGGDDFDSRLLAHCRRRFRRKQLIDISKDKNALSRLRVECEKAKKILSESDWTEIDVPDTSLSKGVDFVCSISRTTFESLCEDLFLKSLETLKQVMKQAALRPEMINDLLLIGGSSRIPKVRQLVKSFFNGKEIRQDIHPEEAVTRGAAIHAAMYLDGGITPIEMQDVTPLSLGINVFGGFMSTIIPRNTAIPAERTETYTTTEDDQKNCAVDVYRGERKFSEDNTLLKEFTLKHIPAARRGVNKFPITFKVDADGLLQMKAQPRPGAPMQTIQIKDPCDLPECELKRMLKNAIKMKEIDLRELDRVKVRNQLYFKCYDKRKNSLIGLRCQETLEWLAENPEADKDLLSKKLDEVNKWIKQSQLSFKKKGAGAHSK